MARSSRSTGSTPRSERSPGWPLRSSLELRIVGDGSQRSKLQTLASSLGVADGLSSWRVRPDRRAGGDLATSDVGVVAMKQDRYRDLTLAGKMFDYITMASRWWCRPRVRWRRPSPRAASSPSSPMTPATRPSHPALHHDPKLAMSYARRAKESPRPYSWPVQRRRYWEVVDALLDSAQLPTGTCRGRLPAMKPGTAANRSRSP